MSVENKQVRGDASVSRNVNAGGNARVQGNMHVGHNLRVDGTVEAQNIKAANKGLFLDEAQLKARYPQPEEGWFAGVGSSSPFVVYIARKDADGRVNWYATNGTFSVDVDMDSYNQRIDELESQVAELIEIILSGGGGNVVNVRVSVEGHGSVTGSGLYQIGNSVTVTATAENGYHFVEWQDAEGNTITGAGATYTFEATESVTLKAVFVVSYFTVTVGTDQTTLGGVGINPAVPAGQSGYTYNTHVTLTATPVDNASPGAYFVRWDNGQGVQVSTSATYQHTVVGDAVFKAVFAQVAIIQRSVHRDSTGNGTIEALVTRGGETVAENDVRIGDHVRITLTGTSRRPSDLLANDSSIKLQCDVAADGKTWTYDFDYTGSESLTFIAKFSGEPITVSYSIEVEVNNSAYGNVHIEVDGENVGTQKNIPDGTGVQLVAVPKTGFAFDTENGWKKGSVVIGTGLRAEITVSSTTAGKYTAYFKHEGEPDFYYGAVIPDATSGNAYDKTGLIAELTAGWIMDNNNITTPEIEIGSERKFIILYNPSKVTPTYMKLGEDLSDPNQYEEFDNTGINNPRNFVHGEEVAENYNSFEGNVAVATGDTQYCQVTFTKLQTQE